MSSEEPYPAERPLDILILEVLGRIQDQNAQPVMAASNLRAVIEYGAATKFIGEPFPLQSGSDLAHDIDRAVKRLEEHQLIRIVPESMVWHDDPPTLHHMEYGKGRVFKLTDQGYEELCRQRTSYQQSQVDNRGIQQETHLQRYAREGLVAFIKQQR